VKDKERRLSLALRHELVSQELSGDINVVGLKRHRQICLLTEENLSAAIFPFSASSYIVSLRAARCGTRPHLVAAEPGPLELTKVH
jgi:hypothetical protein